MLGGVDGFYPLESFKPTPEGLDLAKLTGNIMLRGLAVPMLIGRDSRIDMEDSP
jgi:hypothetical protein